MALRETHAVEEDAAAVDLLVVGAGPSAMGLLYGLLSAYVAEESVPVNIVVIDPGIQEGDEDYQLADGDMARDARRWFRAALEGAHAMHQGVTESYRVIDIPIGAGRGGTSRINATLCLPPRRQDFESWPEPWRTELMGSVAHVLETLHANGALHISHAGNHTADEANDAAWLPNHYVPTADEPLPWRETRFPSVAHHIPCTVDPVSPPRRARRDYYTGLLRPLLRGHPHLARAIRWVRGTVERLLFDGCRVVGVEYQHDGNGSWRELRARRVVLAAGAIESPALLLVSGVGRAADVARVRFSEYRGAVGHKLRDHVMLPRALWKRRGAQEASRTVNGVQSLYQLQVEEALFQVAVMDSTAYTDILPHLVAGLVRYRFTVGGLSRAVNKTLTQASWLLFGLIRVVLSFILGLPPILYILRYHISTITMFHMNPTTSGTVQIKLRSDKPNESASPLRRCDYDLQIVLRYTSNAEGLDDLLKGWIATDSLGFRGVEIFPGPLIRNMTNQTLSRYCFDLFAQVACLSYFHWCGTCAMKMNFAGDGWVVDSRLQMRDIDGIWVCDASILPTTISAPPALTCAAIGHVFGSNILHREISRIKRNSRHLP